MGELSISQLERKKAELLRKAGVSKKIDNIAKQAALKRARLKAEIKALQSPRSIRAKMIARNLAVRSGKALFRGGVVFGKHLAVVAREQDMPTKKRKVMKKKTKTRKKK